MLRHGGRFGLLLLALLLARESQAFSLLRAQTELCQFNICVGGPLDTGPGAVSSFSHDWGGSEQNFLTSAAAVIADYDHFGLQAGTEFDYTLGPAGSFPVVVQAYGSRAIAELYDVLTVSGGSGIGTVRMQWEISGGVDIGFVGSDSVFVVNTPTQLMLTCGAQAGPSILNCSDRTFNFSASEQFNELVTVDIQVQFGTPTQYVIEARLASGLFFQTEPCDNCVVDFHGRANADFSSTATLVDVRLFDGTGMELDPSGIQAESLFRYDLVGQDVPEPLGLAWAALAGRWLIRRRSVSYQDEGGSRCWADVSGAGSHRP